MKVIFLFTIILSLMSSAMSQTESKPIVFTHVTIIDAVAGAGAQSDMTVVVADGKIADIGKFGKIKIPKNSQMINAGGKFLIPGLWDMHVHLAKTGENTLPLFIANGVTSVRDMGGDPALVLKWRKEVAEGKRLGPRIKAAGPILETVNKIEELRSEKTVEPFERFRIGVGNPQDAFTAVNSVAKLGVDFIKIRTVQSVETYRAIAEAARRNGLMLVGHASVPLEEIIRAGQHSIEHAIFPPLDKYSEAERKALFKSMVEKNIAVVPTIVVGQESIFVPKKKAIAIVEDAKGKIDFRRKYLSGYLIDDWREQVGEREDSQAEALKKFRPNILRDLKEMRQTGVRFMAGTDAGVILIYPGFTLHTELQLLVSDVGLSPMEALVSATRYPAEFFGMQNTLGTIEKGKIADLILLDANPLDDIGNTKRIAAVVFNGKYLSKKTLEKMLADVEAAANKK